MARLQDRVPVMQALEQQQLIQLVVMAAITVLVLAQEQAQPQATQLHNPQHLQSAVAGAAAAARVVAVD